MKTVAIISEYNPFHNGHLYQFKKIREEFGEDTAIVAVMSGNFTQRGEIAIMEKWQRARVAVDCGANLVLELPFPYSMSSAELFARAGVHIVNSLNTVDILSFGSELGDIDALSAFAKDMLTPEFCDALKSELNKKEARGLGYPQLMQRAYEIAFNKTAPDSFYSSNNILALEYLKALSSFSSSIVPHTVKRNGTDYASETIDAKSNIQSATAIRNLLEKGISAEKFIPNFMHNAYLEECERGNAPCLEDRLSSAVLANLRLNDLSAQRIHDADGGLYNRLKNMSFEATDISSLIDLSGTKKYTTARVKRAIWYSFFGVTSSNVKELPEFTQLLALDKIGQALLKKINKNGRITVLTKPSTFGINERARAQKELSDMADSIFQLAKHNSPATSIYKRSPYVKK